MYKWEFAGFVKNTIQIQFVANTATDLAVDCSVLSNQSILLVIVYVFGYQEAFYVYSDLGVLVWYFFCANCYYVIF